jgi:hypothetical protein
MVCSTDQFRPWPTLLLHTPILVIKNFNIPGNFENRFHLGFPSVSAPILQCAERPHSFRRGSNLRPACTLGGGDPSASGCGHGSALGSGPRAFLKNLRSIPTHRRKRLNGLIELVSLDSEFSDDAIDVCHARIVAKEKERLSNTAAWSLPKTALGVNFRDYQIVTQLSSRLHDDEADRIDDFG